MSDEIAPKDVTHGFVAVLLFPFVYSGATLFALAAKVGTIGEQIWRWIEP